MTRRPFDVDALVIGAGPAGAVAALVLARAGARVRVYEAGPLPRHRLCGEFVSPEGVADLTALGIDLRRVGGFELARASVSAGRAQADGALPAPGVAIARFALDAELARFAAAQGAEVITRTRVTALAGSLAQGFEAHTAGSTTDRVRARCVIGAFGRHPLALHALRRPAAARLSVAFKMHRVGPHGLPPRVELHAFEDGYVGFSPLSPERVNVCWVAQQSIIRTLRGGGDAAPFLRAGAGVQPLQALLACTQEDPAARCAESGVQFGAPRPVWQDVLLAGDAAVTPHPLSGDGMAMGVRAGRFAAAYALAFLREDLPAAVVPEAYARAWRREFSSRLRWDSALHALLERPAVVTPMLRILGRWPAAFEALVTRTRGHALLQSPTVEVPR